MKLVNIQLSHVIASFLHQMEHILFRARNLHKKNLAASRNDRRASFLYKLTRTSFLNKFLACLSPALHSMRPRVADDNDAQVVGRMNIINKNEYGGSLQGH